MLDLYISEIALKEKPDVNNAVYPYCLPVVRFLDRIKVQSRVTFFVGENGTGKSTLLEAVAVNFGFNPEGGSRNFNFSTRETHSVLHRDIRVAKGRRPKDGYFLRAESYYNVASNIDAMDGEPSFDLPLIQAYGGKSLHEQSHGESFMSLLQHRFFGNGLYLLDEPEAALSPSRQMTLLAEMDRLVKADSQFVICTHSPILMAYPGADIYVLSEEGIRLTPYEETEHYMITKQFLNNPKGMLRYLLSEE